jgi:hypothetical protein
MYSGDRKLHLIEEVLKVKSESVLIALENVLKASYKNSEKRESDIYDFVGILSKKEAKQMKEAIAESCETIDPNDWK